MCSRPSHSATASRARWTLFCELCVPPNCWTFEVSDTKRQYVLKAVAERHGFTRQVNMYSTHMLDT